VAAVAPPGLRRAGIRHSRGDHPGHPGGDLSAQCPRPTVGVGPPTTIPTPPTSRAWAESWARFFSNYFERILSAYRERVAQYYSEEVRDYPDAYPAAGPVHVLAIASIVGIWIFVRPADQDSVTIVERWEDPVLARRSLLNAPNYEETVRRALEIGEEYVLFDEEPLVNMIDPHPVQGRDIFQSRSWREHACHLADSGHTRPFFISTTNLFAVVHWTGQSTENRYSMRPSLWRPWSRMREASRGPDIRMPLGIYMPAIMSPESQRGQVSYPGLNSV
jgi:hypothetical protein